MPINQVPFSKVPHNATKAEREALFEDYKKRFREANPRHFNADGSQRGFFSTLLMMITGK